MWLRKSVARAGEFFLRVYVLIITTYNTTGSSVANGAVNFNKKEKRI